AVDWWRPAVCRIWIGQDVSRLRSTHREGRMDLHASRCLGWCAGIVRGRRTTVHSCSCRRTARLESRALSHTSATARQLLHGIRAARVEAGLQTRLLATYLRVARLR